MAQRLLSSPHKGLVLIIGLQVLSLVITNRLFPPRSGGDALIYQTAQAMAIGEGYSACKPEYFPFCEAGDLTAAREPLPVLLFAATLSRRLSTWAAGCYDGACFQRQRSALMIRHTRLTMLLLVALLVAALGGAARAQQADFPVPPGRVVAGDDTGLFVMLADGSGKEYLAEEGEADCWLRDGVWSPDGTMIMYTAICGGESPGDWRPDPERTDLRERTAQVMIVDVMTRTVRELVPGDGIHQDYAGDWSPDGEQVVIYSDRDANSIFNLFLYKLSDGSLTQLTTLDSNVSRVSFDPGGNYLLYNRRIIEDSDIRFEVRAFDLKTQTEIPVARGITPNWSPDGRWIAYATEGEVADIFIMPADCVYNGGGCDAQATARNVTLSPGVAEREPVFSPDQTQLLYLRDTDDAPATLTWDIFRHDLRTGVHTNLTNTPDREERHRSWEPVSGVERVDVATVLPVVARVRTSQNAANLRAEPSTNATIVSTLPNGTLLIVQGALADRTWYRVTLPADGTQAWIYGNLVETAAGDLASVPVVTP